MLFEEVLFFLEILFQGWKCWVNCAQVVFDVMWMIKCLGTPAVERNPRVLTCLDRLD